MSSTPHTEGQLSIADAATAKANALSLKLCNLTQIVRLAAFAAEARRTLSGIQDVMHYRPKMQEVIKAGVPYSNNWEELGDNTCDVLCYITSELEEVNSGFTETVYDLAGTVTTEVEKNGGAA